MEWFTSTEENVPPKEKEVQSLLFFGVQKR
jgi:hypothetical protein